MRQPITARLDPAVLEAARGRAERDNRTLADYIESPVRQDLRIEDHAVELEVIATAPESFHRSVENALLRVAGRPDLVMKPGPDAPERR